MRTRIRLSMLGAVSALSVVLASMGGAAAARAADVTQVPVLTLEGAKKVLAAAVAESRRAEGTGAIAVVDAGGDLLALERLDGTFRAGADVSTGKARTALRFQKPTRFFEELIRNGRTPMIALPDFTPLMGGVPLVVGGHVVGAVGVSGAASAQRDEEIAIAGAAALEDTATDAPEDAVVRFFEKGCVQASFERGAPLLETGAFKIHTSRREKAGQAEVHEHETDVLYVQEGAAELVTGGEIVAAERTAPGEQRGASIAGGSRQRLVPGDVVVVPKGVPHWFAKVDGPFTYYVVKIVERS